MYPNPLIVQNSDTLSEQYFNQVIGKNLEGWFEKNNIRYAEVQGNAQIVYYLWDDGKNKKEKAIELMKQVGLKESYAKRRILRLSGGEQQRVAIARSLSYNPDIIIADEPTGNLDKKTEEDIIKIFNKLAKEENKCVIIVTHSENVCSLVDEVYELKKAKDKQLRGVVMKKDNKQINQNRNLTDE